MLKRKFAKHCGFAVPSGIGVTEEVVSSDEIRDDGTVFKRVSVQNVPLDEIDNKLRCISPEEYTLDNLIKAGVPMDQVNLSGFMAPTDKSVLEKIMEDKSVAAYLGLIDEEKKVASAKSAKTSTPVETPVTENKTE